MLPFAWSDGAPVTVGFCILQALVLIDKLGPVNGRSPLLAGLCETLLACLRWGGLLYDIIWRLLASRAPSEVGGVRAADGVGLAH